MLVLSVFSAWNTIAQVSVGILSPIVAVAKPSMWAGEYLQHCMVRLKELALLLVGWLAALLDSVQCSTFQNLPFYFADM